MELLPADPAALRVELRCAVDSLSQRRLKASSRWAAELLIGLGRGSGAGAGVNPAASAVAAPTPATRVAAFTEEPSDLDSDALLLARTYFDSGEFRRCSHVLDQAASGGVFADKAFFLRCFALYLAGEKRKEEEIDERPEDDKTSPPPANTELKDLLTLLAPMEAGGKLDAFGLYIFGVVLKEMGKKEEARRVLLASVAAYPLNWSAWLDLAALCQDRETLMSLSPVEHWTRDFFYAHALLELQINADALTMYNALFERFPTSPYVKSRIAQAMYNMRQFDEAQASFQAIYAEDPYRLEGIDTYSNILYVKEDKAVLSFLAHSAMKLDKFRPETCCVVGNYYSLRAEHELAVVYFRRALRVNRRYLSAWTLMGHEYVEMKNAGAAIEAYRHAVDINPLDYRAWYGLGQTYEILRMFFYALYYYRKATSLRPYDPRMWRAMAGCYEELDRHDDAIKCYERANTHADREGIATLKLARLYRTRGDQETAARYFREHLAQQEREEGAATSADCAQAMLFLAQFARDRREYAEAEALASKLLGMPWPQEVKEAQALLRELRSRGADLSSSPFAFNMDVSGFSAGTASPMTATPGWLATPPGASRGPPSASRSARVTPQSSHKATVTPRK